MSAASENTFSPFGYCYDHSMLIEGGWVNHPKDPGKETYKGISRRFWSGWGGWPIIDAIKDQGPFSVAELNSRMAADFELQFMVRDFYLAEFWNRMLCDEVADVSLLVAQELFDTGINMNTFQAVRYLQRVLNVMDKGRLGDITVDGVMGGQTLSRLRRMIGGSPDRALVIARYQDSLQGAGYIERAERDGDKEDFIAGWGARRLGVEPGPWT